MRLPKGYAADKTAQATRRMRAEGQLSRHLEFVAVCLVGTETSIPRFNGDNRGGWPVRVVVTRGWRRKPGKQGGHTLFNVAAQAYDRASPYHKFTVLEHVNVRTREHAVRLKAALDVCLLGQQKSLGNDSYPPRHQFRDVMGCWDDRDTRSVWWGTLLGDAVRECQRSGATGRFDLFDGEERRKRERTHDLPSIIKSRFTSRGRRPP